MYWYSGFQWPHSPSVFNLRVAWLIAWLGKLHGCLPAVEYAWLLYMLECLVNQCQCGMHGWQPHGWPSCVLGCTRHYTRVDVMFWGPGCIYMLSWRYLAETFYHYSWWWFHHFLSTIKSYAMYFCFMLQHCAKLFDSF